jgi:ketosteroid isomerase-like protein
MGQKSVLSDPAEEIRALEIARNVAIAHGDVSALDKMTSDDYTFINVGGQLHTKAEFLKEFATNAFKYEYRQIYDLKNSSVWGCGRGNRSLRADGSGKR